MSYLRYVLVIVVFNTYCVVFFFLFSWSYVPYIANFSGLSIGDCPFGILQRLSNKLHYLGIININHIFICNTVHTKN
jgi:hypothetical protein